MLAFPPETRIADLQDRITRADLVRATQGMLDHILALVSDLPDACVTFEPQDPLADDPHASRAERRMPWTLGHVIAHITASGEEGAARGLTLARNVEVLGRSRYETPWHEITTTAQVVRRLQESRRMRLAMLDAWPDEPHLDKTCDLSWAGSLNAVGMVLTGLKHDADHLNQIEDIIRQARAALG
jgi:hypothetical protein